MGDGSPTATTDVDDYPCALIRQFPDHLDDVAGPKLNPVLRVRQSGENVNSQMARKRQ
jgi:hypothetical protein